MYPSSDSIKAEIHIKTLQPKLQVYPRHATSLIANLAYECYQNVQVIKSCKMLYYINTSKITLCEYNTARQCNVVESRADKDDLGLQHSAHTFLFLLIQICSLSHFCNHKKYQYHTIRSKFLMAPGTFTVQNLEDSNIRLIGNEATILHPT